jgi:hypothetical protein
MRKLFKAVKDSTSADGGEYGVVTDAMMETIQAKADLARLNLMNDALGGEAATKDVSLLTTGGMQAVLAAIAAL